MSKGSELLSLAQKRLYPNYKPAPMILQRGKGCELFDVEGKRWLDMAAGVAVCSVGHAHPKLVKALAEQAGMLMHTSNYFYNEQNVLLADALCERSGMGRAFFCNSGAEANEAAFKLARRHFYAKGDKKRTKFIAFDNAFHGRTMGAVSLTGTPKYREGFGCVEGVVHVPYGDLEAVKKVMTDEVAAIVVEPVQGEGGVLPAPAGFLESLRALTTERGALLVLDEVQTGIGRTGAWFAHQHVKIKPDLMALAKGLGGGAVIGCLLTTEELAGALPPGTHGSTFGGNPFASRAALTVIEIIEEEGLVAGAKAKGDKLSAALAAVAKDLPNVCEGERGQGLLRGLILKQGMLARDVLPKIADAGLLLTAAGERVLRFTPPLVISEAEIAEGVDIVRKVLSTPS
ncbi:MAG: aspartate aminotransferase family protein [Labilithrix sp.]|nr:aspartate aminotransferase family protein [Labilithrix sp.]MCW5815549.1 aspartate aminotransferase family protein [Labilithrix sp.]